MATLEGMETETELLSDIYDGRVWKNSMSFNGVPFLSEFTSIGLMMNIDGFNHLKIVMIILLELFILLNLPRNIRFRSENVIVAGLTPAFKKEPHSINSFLNPIVEELQVLWKGVRLESSFLNCASVLGQLYFVYLAIYLLQGSAVVLNHMQVDSGVISASRFFQEILVKKWTILVLIDRIGSRDLSHYTICMLGR